MAKQLRYFLSRALRDWILCSAWKKWIRNPTTHPWSLWRRCNETMKGELRARSDQEVKTVCSTFSRSGWSVVRSASLTKGTSKKRPSPHLYKVPIRSNKASPRTFQPTLVYVILRRMTQWSWIGKRVQRSRYVAVKLLSQYLSKWTKETMNNRSQNIWCPWRDLNSGAPK
jgi:hypothetical protein